MARGPLLSSHLRVTGKTLLERAKDVQPHKGYTPKFSDEELELVLAWINDEISLKQILVVLGLKNTGNIYVFLARGARELWRKNNK